MEEDSNGAFPLEQLLFLPEPPVARITDDTLMADAIGRDVIEQMSRHMQARIAEDVEAMDWPDEIPG